MSQEKSVEKDWKNVWRVEEIKEAEEDKPASKLVAGFLSKYPKGSKVLDAGSGLGSWVFNWQKKGYEAYGVEIVSEAVGRSREYAGLKKLDCKFLVGDIRKMSFPDNFFDAVFSFGTVEHFDETFPAIQELYRVTKNDGTCFITTPNVYSVRTFLTRPILNVLKNPRLGYQGFEKSFTPLQLAEMMKTAGFRELKYGIAPDGILLGDFYQFIPFVGKYIGFLPKKISLWVESHQSKLGHTAYCAGVK